MFNTIKFVIIFSLIFSVSSLFAQTGDSAINELAEKWENAKGYTLKMAQLMPENLYDFKPVAEEMTFGEQLIHIAQNIHTLSAIINGTKSTFIKPAHPTRNEILALVGQAYDTGMITHQKLSATKLEEKVAFFAGPKTRRQVLVIMHDHQTHHMGQLIVYGRLEWY